MSSLALTLSSPLLTCPAHGQVTCTGTFTLSIPSISVSPSKHTAHLQYSVTSEDSAEPAKEKKSMQVKLDPMEQMALLQYFFSRPHICSHRSLDLKQSFFISDRAGALRAPLTLTNAASRRFTADPLSFMGLNHHRSLFSFWGTLLLLHMYYFTVS